MATLGNHAQEFPDFLFSPFQFSLNVAMLWSQVAGFVSVGFFLGVLLSADKSHATSPCLDVACASVVSKCMLTQACKCDINRTATECSCCRNCTQCLGNDYMRCCSCLGLCELTNDISLGQESQVGDIDVSFNDLFEAFNAAPDDQWTTYTFPIETTLREFAEKAKLDNSVMIPEFSSAEQDSLKSTNCTVMFWNQCMSVSKCNNYCNQYGAASYRYFFDGCCECVGLKCLNYGLDQSKCLNCSNFADEDIPEDLRNYKEEFDNEIN